MAVDGGINVPFEPDFTNFAAKVRVGLNTTLKGMDPPDIPVDAEFRRSQIRAELRQKSLRGGKYIPVPVAADFNHRQIRTALNVAGKQAGPLHVSVDFDRRQVQRALRLVSAPIAGRRITVDADVNFNRARIDASLRAALSSRGGVQPSVRADVVFTRAQINTELRRVTIGSAAGRLKVPASLSFSRAEITRDLRAVLKTMPRPQVRAVVDFNAAQITAAFAASAKLSKFVIDPVVMVKAPSLAYLRAIRKEILLGIGPIVVPVRAITTVSRTVGAAGVGAAGASLGSLRAEGRAVDNLKDKIVALSVASQGAGRGLMFASRGISGMTLLTGAAVLGVGHLTAAVIRFGTQAATHFETSRRAIESFLRHQEGIKDLTAATKAFYDQISTFAEITPFNLESVTSSAQTLFGAGFKAQEIIPALTNIGDLGAQLGVDGPEIERVTRALAKIRGQGKLTQRELRTVFTALPGFNPYEALAENVPELEGANRGAVVSAITRGAISATEAVQALLKGMGNFPSAAGAMYRQSLTTAGSLEVLRDRMYRAARDMIAPSLPFLARDMREASHIILEGSDELGKGLASTFRNAGSLIGPLFQTAIPLVNHFSRALGESIPILADFFDEFGEPMANSFGLFIKLMPVVLGTTSAFLKVLEPAVPVLNLFTSALDMIPKPLLSIVAAYKILNSLRARTGILGGAERLGAKFNQQGEIIRRGFFDRIRSNSTLMRNQIARDTSAIGGTLASKRRLWGSTSTFVRKEINSMAYDRYVDRFIASERRRQSVALQGADLDRQLAKQRAASYGTRFMVSPYGVTEDLSNIKKVNTAMVGMRDRTIAGARLMGAALRSNVAAGFRTVVNAARSAGSAILGFFGGPIGLAITAATIGLTVMVQKWQEAKQAAKEYAEEAKIAGELAALDVSSETRIQSAQEIMASLIKAGRSQDDIEAVLRGRVLSDGALRSLASGRQLSEFDQRWKPILTGTSPATQDQAYDALSKEAIDALSRGLRSDEIARLVNDRKRREKLIAQLRASNRAEGLSFTDLFKDTDADKANKYASQLENTVDQILNSSREAQYANAQLARNLGREDLAKFYEKQAKYIERHKVLPRNIKEISQNTRELIQVETKARASALNVALGLEKNTEALDALGGAAQIAKEELDELNATIDASAALLDTFSFDQVMKALKPEQFSVLAMQYGSLVNSGGDTATFIQEFIRTTGLEDSTDTRKEVIAAFSGFRRMLTDEYQSMVDTLKEALPNISTVFEEKFELSKGSVGAKAVTKRIEELSEFISGFATNIKTIAEKDFGTVAHFLASQGPQVAGLAAEQLAKELNAGQTKTAKALQNAQTEFDGAVNKAGEYMSASARAALAAKYNIDPEFIVDPQFQILTPDEKKIAAIKQSVKDIEAQIQEGIAEAYREMYPGPRKNKDGNYIPTPATTADPRLQKLLIGINPQLKKLQEEKTKMQNELKAMEQTLFTSLNTQANTSAGAINLAFSNAKIDEAIKPQVDTIKQELKSIPDVVAESINTSRQDGSKILVAGGLFASDFLRGFNYVMFSELEVTKVVLSNNIKSIGQILAESMASGFASKSSEISTAILTPFRNTRFPLNTYIRALQSLGVAVGVQERFAQIPEFHAGGIVGRDRRKHRGGIDSSEQIAVLKKGEGVLPLKTMAKIGHDTFDSLRKGELEIGGPPVVSQEVSSSIDSAPYKRQINTARDEYRRNYSVSADSARLVNRIADKVVDVFHKGSINYVDTVVPFPYNTFGPISAMPLSGDQQTKYDRLSQMRGRPGSWRVLAGLIGGSGVPHRITSAVRPGSITSSGRVSMHSFGRAIDIAGPTPGSNTTALGNIFKAFRPYEPLLSELIYSGDQVGYNIKNGRRVGKYAVKDHRNHVHAALYSGGIVRGSRDGGTYTLGEKYQSELVLPSKQPGRIYRVLADALNQNILSDSAVRAIQNAVTNNRVSHSDNSRQVINHNKIDINVERNSKDDVLFAGTVARRVRSAFRKVG